MLTTDQKAWNSNCELERFFLTIEEAHGEHSLSDSVLGMKYSEP